MFSDLIYQRNANCRRWVILFVGVPALIYGTACASTGKTAVKTSAQIALAPLATDSAMRAAQVALRSQALGGVRDVGVQAETKPVVVVVHPQNAGGYNVCGYGSCGGVNTTPVVVVQPYHRP